MRPSRRRVFKPGDAQYGEDGRFAPIGRRAGEGDLSRTSSCLADFTAPPKKKREAETDLVLDRGERGTEVISVAEIMKSRES